MYLKVLNSRSRMIDTSPFGIDSTGVRERKTPISMSRWCLGNIGSMCQNEFAEEILIPIFFMNFLWKGGNDFRLSPVFFLR